jgi:hypothetical protein
MLLTRRLQREMLVSRGGKHEKFLTQGPRGDDALLQKQMFQLR